MIVELDYGLEKLKVNIPDKNLLGVLSSKTVTPVSNPSDGIIDGIRNPIGTEPLEKQVKGKKRICIVISDITRAVPTKMILSALLGELYNYGFNRDSILIIVATGLHRPNVGKELEALVGKEIAAKYHIINHDARDRKSCMKIGKTKRGTPVIINKAFMDSDFKILTGLIEPHFMAGFSGGRKAVCPGMSYMDMFKHFHGPEILESPNASFGILKDNPFHEESTEIAKMAGADFIVNVTIDKNKNVTGIFCGDLDNAFYRGAEFCLDASTCRFDSEADMVITTGGGLPLDATLYQTVKGMVGAVPVVRQGGMIIVASECREEIGSPEFVEIMQQENDFDEFIEKIWRKDYFKIDQWEFEELIKAARKADLYLYSSCLLKSSFKIPDSTLRIVNSVDEALQVGFDRFGDDAKIITIPEGPYVIPVRKSK
jgi:nickel-dependent lactate racemase